MWDHGSVTERSPCLGSAMILTGYRAPSVPSDPTDGTAAAQVEMPLPPKSVAPPPTRTLPFSVADIWAPA